MEELTTNVNWIAVIVSAVAAFILGWLWYSPKLFGTKWAEGVGVDLAAATGMPVAAMLTQVITTFLLAWVVGVTAARVTLKTMILITVTILILMIAGSFSPKKALTLLQQRLVL
ncbi:MAG: DUF1761 domain-containing protein [Gammaproteobacteria bacterium]|nr:DUF1761 domain-containing protein [Gammaproteobacteria bacterium]